MWYGIYCYYVDIMGCQFFYQLWVLCWLDKINQCGFWIQQGNFIVIWSIDFKDDIRLLYFVVGYDFSFCFGKGFIVKVGQFFGVVFYCDVKVEFE